MEYVSSVSKCNICKTDFQIAVKHQHHKLPYPCLNVTKANDRHFAMFLSHESTAFLKSFGDPRH
jgi:hypothetical protein